MPIADYSFGQAMWTMFVFFAWVLFFWLLFVVFGDLFRRHDISGWGKAGWTIFVIVLPFLGVFIYLIVRGSSMHERQLRDAQAQEQQFRTYVQDAAGSGSSADELTKLADLRDRGVITDAEFQQGKAKVLGA